MSNSAIVLHVEAGVIKKSAIGSRVLDPGAFIRLLLQELQETGEAQRFDGADQPIIQLRTQEVVQLVAAGHGPLTRDAERLCMREGRMYLRRAYAYGPRGAFAIVYSREYYERLRSRPRKPGEKSRPALPEGTTHLLAGVEVVDDTTDCGNPPWAMRVADEE